jgi:hypothetical protein
MPHFLLTFGDARRPPVGAVIIEAPSMFQARMTAGCGAWLPACRSGDEASQLILRLFDGGRPWK